MKATMKPTPASAATTKNADTARSARFSALVPGIGNRLRRCTMCTPCEAAPMIICSSVLSSRSSSASGTTASPCGWALARGVAVPWASCWVEVMPSPRSTRSPARARRRRAPRARCPSDTGPIRSMPLPPGSFDCLQRLDVGDDRLLLVGRQLVVVEHRHALGPGQHRGVDLLRGRVVEAGRGLAGRQRRALAGRAVAGRAVEPEQLAALGELARSRRRGRRSGSCGPPPIDWTYAASASVCGLGELVRSSRSARRPGRSAGMRPVLTWK